MTHLAKEIRQQKEQRGIEQKLKRIGGGGVSNAGDGLHKLGRVGTFCQIWELYMSGKTSLTH